ncbi:MAG: hypothetical protein NTY09_11125 [bacterium]|nr:hypothetical protein [bacterium]
MNKPGWDMLKFSRHKQAYAESTKDFQAPDSRHSPIFNKHPFIALKSLLQFLPIGMQFRFSFAHWLFMIPAMAILASNSQAIAQSGQPSTPCLQLLSPANVSPSPGDIITASIRVTNTFQDRRTIRISAVPPPDWEFSINPEIFELDSGETGISFISLAVPIDAPPGESEIFLNAFPEEDPSHGSSVQVKVTIVKMTRLEIHSTGQDQPDIAAGDWITQTFMLSNLGNSSERVRIEVQANQDWDIVVEPSDPIHIMEPRQTDIITVNVHSPQNLANSTDLHLSLYARLDEPEAEIAAQAVTSIRIAASQVAQQSIYPPLHGYVNLIADLVDNEEAAFSVGIGPLRCDLDENRQLVVGPVNLLLGGNSPGAFIEDQRISASYMDDNLGYIRAGDFSLDLGSPLLEHYLWGRGGDILYKDGDIGYRAFYTHTRGSRPETDAGIQLIIDLGETAITRLTALRNTESGSRSENDTTDNSATNLGLYAAFTPFTGATIAGEFAGTDSPNSGFNEAWRLSGRYRIEGLSLNYEWLQADDDFRGGYRDDRIGRFDMSFRPIDNINLWANYNISRNNINNDPDEEAIHARDLTLGGAWTIDGFGRLGVTRRSERDVDVAEWSLDERRISTEYSYSVNFNNVYASTVYRLQTINDQLTGDIERNRSLQLQCVARVNDSASLRFNLTSGRSSLNTGELTRHLTSAGLGCNLRLGRNFDLSSNIERNIGNSSGQRTNIVGSLGWTMSEGRRLRLHLRSLLDSFGNNIEIALEYDSPISIPLNIVPIMGRLEGRLFLSNDPDRGISGVRVLVDGFEAVTNDSGYFIFPALSPGDYTLNLDTATLNIGLAPEIDLPAHFAMEAGSTVEMEIPMIQYATVEGYVRLESSAADGEIKTDAPLGGILIELKNESGSDFRHADDLGHFVFSDLAPGTYTLKIRSETLPENNEAVDSTEYTINVAPGEVISDIEFLVMTVEQEIVVVLGSDLLAP